jgi:hypothetical protein
LCTKSLPSSALAHLSALSKSLTTEVSSSFTDSFSFILMLAKPVENAEITSSLEILGNLVPHLVEALDVLAKHFTLVLTHHLEIILGGGALIRGHEVGDKLMAEILPRSY